MILQKYPEINKTVTYIVSLYPRGYNANCSYGKRCKPYRMPISLAYSADMYWYVNAEKQIASVSWKATNCSGWFESITPNYYVAGYDNGGNNILIFNGFTALPSARIFQIWAEVTYTDGTIRSYFSEEYESVSCESTNMVYSCYDKSDGGGYDMNGAWIGSVVNPYSVNGGGNATLRYFNNYLIRDLKVLYSGSQITYKLFNYRSVKSERVKTYNIMTEVVPYWYEEAIGSAFAKGYVYIDGRYYTISDYKSTPVGDLCCERMTLDITAQEYGSVGMSCSVDCSVDDVVTPDCTLGTLSYTEQPIENDCSLGNLSQTTYCINC